MVNAGRILILAKGSWSSTTNYMQLDLVSYNSIAYLARQASVGVNPAQDTQMNYWMPFGSAASIATTSTPGLVMPDGQTITITNTGLIKAVLGLNDVSDVTITSPAGGDTLVYNATTQKWENSTVIQTLTNQVKDMNNVYGSKNLLSQKYMQVLLRGTPVGNKVESINGLTIVYGEDGSIEINGTPTDSSKPVAIHFDWTTSVYDYNIENLAGEKVIGSITDTQINGIRLLLGCFLSDGTSNQSGYIYTNGEYTYPSDAVWGRTWLSISGEYSYNHAKVYPMIRLASIEDDTYEPYAKTNQQLTAENQTLTTQINKAYKSDDSTESAIADDDYIPFYDSSTQTTKKISKANAKFGGGALYFTGVACAATTGDFATVSNANITANHVVVSVEYANPSAITSDVTWTTANGSVTLNGTCASATTCSIVLVEKDN